MTTNIISPENLVYAKPALLNDTTMHYCPGCSHGVVHKLIAEVIADMGMEEKTVGISPVGCRKLLTDVPLHWPRASKDYGPTAWYSLIRVMATLLVSVRPKHCTR